MSARDYLDGKDEPRGPRSGRRRLGLVLVAVIALVVLGVWSFSSPDTRDTSATTPAPSGVAAPTDGGASEPLPPLVTDPPTVPEAPSTPVRVPVTVLNATSTNG